MTARAAVFIATSLDGFIARSDGSIDWLEQANAAVPAGEDCGYQAFMADIDAIVMGRHTFEQVAGFDPWPYEAKPVFVLSSGALAIPVRLAGRAFPAGAAPAELAKRLGAQGLRRLYVDGGRTIRSFLAADLVDRLTITVIPLLLGQGRPLFDGTARGARLALESSVRYPFGFVQSTYRVLR